MAKILVLFGGTSSEHDISLKSAATVISILENTEHDVLKIGITKSGRWLHTEASAPEIADGSWETNELNCRAILSPERLNRGILLLKDQSSETVNIDCVWPVLHGKYGEDGTIQGLCELAGIPYVGPGVCASAMGMDKSITKIAVEKTGILQADYYLVKKYNYRKAPANELKAVQEHFDSRFPLFVKPCAAGSSVGVTKVEDADALADAIELALKHDAKVLVEIAIVGREVEVAVLGNEEPRASVVGEVLSANDFYDYTAKYINSASRTVIPAEIPRDTLHNLQNAAVTIYSALDCKGLSRVDFFVDKNGEIIFNEINTLPGFTNISMYPKLWEASGISNIELANALISLALESACLSSPGT